VFFDMVRRAMPKVLIVDDNPDSCSALRRLLARAGWEVRCVTEGKAALEGLAEMGAEVVLLDIMMPEVDGFDVLGQIRSDPRTARTRVVMYSALSDEGTKERARAAGADDFVVKGAPFEVIRERLGNGG
jgi:PleD family two-component response regulator